VFTWRAIYKDDSEHPYDTLSYNIANIDSAKLDIFQIIDEGSDIPYLSVHMDDPRKRLIYVRRTEKSTTLPYPIICHLVGWQMKVGNENVQVINYVFETIIVSFKEIEHNGVKAQQRVEKHLAWIETAGKFNQKRDSHFKSPTKEQLEMACSDPKA